MSRNSKKSPSVAAVVADPSISVSELVEPKSKKAKKAKTPRDAEGNISLGDDLPGLETSTVKPSKKTKKAAKALKASRSRSPEAKAARRLIRSYFFAAMIATSKDQDADTVTYFTAKAERLEAQLDDAFATVAACRVR